MRFASLLLALLLIPSVIKAEPKQGVFPISFWCAPTTRFTTLERYREIKEAGFTHVFPPCSGSTVELNKMILDLCQQVGLKAYISDSRIPTALAGDASKAALDAMIRDYAKYPALAGYFICDEPWGGAFPGLAGVVNYLKEKDSQHPGYINLLPNYAPANVYDAPNYQQHVRNYATIVKPFAISYDHYHMGTGGDRPGFFNNLSDVRTVSLESNIPFWQIVLVVQHGGYRNLTEGELRYEAMQTLAYGGKGLMWFTYWSPAESDKSLVWKHAMINEDGSHDPHYAMVQKINRDLQAIGTELLNATSTAVFQTGKLPPGGTAAPKDSPIQFVYEQPNATIGLFKSEKHTLALVANQDYKTAVRAGLQIVGGMEQFDPDTRSWNAVPIPASLTHMISLPPGDAVLLRW